MKIFNLILSLLLIFSCSFNVRKNTKNNESMFLLELPMTYSKMLDDSLRHFINTVDRLPNRNGVTVYSVDVSKHNDDTLVSFWAFHSVLYSDSPFNDSRFLFELAQETSRGRDLLSVYNGRWDKMQSMVVGESIDFVQYGAKELNDSSVIALTIRYECDAAWERVFTQLDKNVFNANQLCALGDDDRLPTVKVYRYDSKTGLELILQRFQKRQLIPQML